MNPGRTCLSNAPGKCPWSSAAARISGQNEPLVDSRGRLKISKKAGNPLCQELLIQKPLQLFGSTREPAGQTGIIFFQNVEQIPHPQ
jgi:hypothetical protein